MPSRRTLVLGLSAAALSGCAPRARIVLVPGAATAGAVREVFVATTRQAGENGENSALRAPQIGFARYLVSVPPVHESGEIELPRRGQAADPARHFVTAGFERYGSAPEFRAALSAALRATPRGGREAVVYVHGFNNTFAEGVYRTAQIGHDLQVPAVAVHYAWPSAAQPLNYAYDRDSALFARDGLERLLEELRAAGARHVTLVAHSMGAQLSMETLRQIEIGGEGRVRRLVQAVVLFAPDIDVELFRAQALRIGRLPDPFVIFTSRRDGVLLLSARLTGQRARLGNLQDFGAVADLDVILLDVSAFSDGSAFNHFSAASSPTLLSLFSSIGAVEAALGGERAGRAGLFPGTVLTLQNATAIILTPVAAVAN